MTSEARLGPDPKENNTVSNDDSNKDGQLYGTNMTLWLKPAAAVADTHTENFGEASFHIQFVLFFYESSV